MDMKIMKEIYDAYKKLGYDENAARMFAAYRMERLENAQPPYLAGEQKDLRRNA